MNLAAHQVSALQDWIWASGATTGMDAIESDAVSRDLFWIVGMLLQEEVNHAVTAVKMAALLATRDCIADERSSVFQSMQRQFACPQ